MTLNLKRVQLPLDVAPADYIHAGAVLARRQSNQLLGAALIRTLTLQLINSHHSFIGLLTVQKLTDSNIVLILLHMLVIIPYAEL